mmetsp:Transcript_58107/g.180510  ORF Transcript_58107/g.180510 Transcript_58107/m.180510 type:complete len:270 (-) Transcript_58107:702-1511(-)
MDLALEEALRAQGREGLGQNLHERSVSVGELHALMGGKAWAPQDMGLQLLIEVIPWELEVWVRHDSRDRQGPPALGEADQHLSEFWCLEEAAGEQDNPMREALLACTQLSKAARHLHALLHVAPQHSLHDPASADRLRVRAAARDADAGAPLALRGRGQQAGQAAWGAQPAAPEQRLYLPLLRPPAAGMGQGEALELQQASASLLDLRGGDAEAEQLVRLLVRPSAHKLLRQDAVGCLKARACHGHQGHAVRVRRGDLPRAPGPAQEAG